MALPAGGRRHRDGSAGRRRARGVRREARRPRRHLQARRARCGRLPRGRPRRRQPGRSADERHARSRSRSRRAGDDGDPPARRAPADKARLRRHRHEGQEHDGRAARKDAWRVEAIGEGEGRTRPRDAQQPDRPRRGAAAQGLARRQSRRVVIERPRAYERARFRRARAVELHAPPPRRRRVVTARGARDDGGRRPPCLARRRGGVPGGEAEHRAISGRGRLCRPAEL